MVKRYAAVDPRPEAWLAAIICTLDDGMVMRIQADKCAGIRPAFVRKA